MEIESGAQNFHCFGAKSLTSCRFFYKKMDLTANDEKRFNVPV
jgi:hypothetical protein